ncbi:MAG: FkbM family methyltransferase, partial [Siphonobacter aquaeclarae]|nr:FkbM family methyltransferase [Siphonobacter aquaeclarae]
NQTVASVFADFHENNTRQIEVPSLSLTEVLEGESSVDLLKLDCEGSEYDILYHTDPLLIRRIDRILAEIHDLDEDRRNVREMSRFLQEAGFRVQYEWLQPQCYMLAAVRE